MDPLDLARWQFAITTVYHFLFVPLTIGLSGLVAAYQTAWLRTRDERWLRVSTFLGRLFVINVAIGVVTGIVQEFQFGMAWSDYARFVGDVFGAPLAVEGLLAFFLESTFLGLWMFGRGRLPDAVHTACIWLVHVGTLFSAYFILAANSFMQHPVGYHYDPVTGRAEMTDFAAVLLNKVQLVTFPHVLLSAWLTSAGFVLGIGLWHLARTRAAAAAGRPDAVADHRAYRGAVRTAAWVMLVAGLGVSVSGDLQGKVMTEVQPMKMAAAEALYDTQSSAPFSAFTLGTPDGSREVFSVRVPRLLSFLATGSPSGQVQGIHQLQERYRAAYGQDPGARYYSPGDYTPVIPVTYWTFRLMIGLGALASLIGAVVLWATRRGRTPTGRWVLPAAVALPLLPLLANTAGWVFTEMGRQPWAVFGLMTTAQAVSPSVSTVEVLVSLVTFTLLYGVLAVVELRLLLDHVRRGLDPLDPGEPPARTPGGADGAADREADAEDAGADLALAF
ncbi:cytochrome ubiquinol oxidase subunit I [Nocardioides sp. TRM66260-LWL]|uniref:cytochrome ubiquinol oxidase subunit I n=1 Tax=Nocardioides sp. TRM66260-LWL TaxID=2874478 RepID=UPI001CC409DD|nr:cytochrome ubiquinol oxidase subunit I [Nocardioides sp. TRM66260-LWL]MBZ5735781.1 cytochrome ubiquinol oxidase subunit I [Nocardioides sp. TRM66260-LWL]